MNRFWIIYHRIASEYGYLTQAGLYLVNIRDPQWFSRSIEWQDSSYTEEDKLARAWEQRVVLEKIKKPGLRMTYRLHSKFLHRRAHFIWINP